MRFLPHREFEIECAATPETLQAALERATAPDRVVPRSGGSQPFEGAWRGPSFDVQPRHGPRSPRIVVRGMVGPGRLHPRGSRIRGTMEVSGGTLAFLAVWLGLVLLAAIRATSARYHGTTQGWTWMIPWGMAIFGWGGLLLGFRLTTRDAERRLRQLADAAGQAPARLGAPAAERAV